MPERDVPFYESVDAAVAMTIQAYLCQEFRVDNYFRAIMGAGPEHEDED